MIKNTFLVISIILVLSVTGCVKETYDMNMLSAKTHLSPEMALSAVKGDITFSDMVKSNDTIRFDQNNFVTLVFKKDAFIDLKLTDFVKGTIQKTAAITPQSVDLKMDEILSHISGTFTLLNPVIKFNYTNSFPDSLVLHLNVNGEKGTSTVNLNLAPFSLLKPAALQPEVSSSYVINNTNSNISALVSMPPNTINLSGTVTAIHVFKGIAVENAIGANRLLGSLEIDVPLELKMSNLQFCDTVDNFLKSKNSDDPFKPQDFQLLRVDLTAQNGFPLGASLKMSLYNSTTHLIQKTVAAKDILTAAPVDSNGKSNGTSDSKTSIEFTRDFFSAAGTADKIIFWITFNTTGAGSQNIKIYSDYRFSFNAALVVKPDISLK